MPPKRRHTLLYLSLSCLTLGACGEGNSAAGAPSRTDPEIEDARSQVLERKQLERVPDPEPPPSITGEVPDETMRRIRGHLAQRTGAEADSFEVIQGQFVEWPSGAMGCAQPGMKYTQQPVRGYWIVLAHDGQNYDYRVAESGHFIVCERMHFERPPSQ